jgi:sugar/nucleoside kinase (ribokinase family)
VDILFANEQEILSLYKTNDFSIAINHARQDCEIAALTRSEKGSVIISNNSVEEIAPVKAKEVIDTTGAGDMYAAGFLYGLTREASLAECGWMGSTAAAEVISHMGARPQGNLQELMKKRA